MRRKVIDLTTGSPIRQIFLFAIPMFLGEIFTQLYNVVDTIVVGHFVGSRALGAVGSTFPIMFISISIGGGLSVGCSVIISRYIGAKQMKDVRTAISTSLILSLASAVVMTAVLEAVARPLLMFIKTPSDTIEMAYSYLFWYFAGTLFTFMYNGISGIFRAIGDSRTPFYYLVLASLMNVALDLLFVIKFHMGCSGVAIATITSQGVCAVLSGFTLRKTLKKQFSMESDRSQLFDRNMTDIVFRSALPSMMQGFALCLAFLIFQMLVNQFGSLTVSGYTAAIKIQDFAYIPIMNLGSAITTYTSQNYGAAKYHRIKRGFMEAFLLEMSLAIIGGTVIFIFARPLLSILLGSAEAEVYDIAIFHLKRIALVLPVVALMYSCEGVMRGLDEMQFVFIATLLGMAIRTAVAFYIIPILGFRAVWWVSSLGDLFEAIFILIRYCAKTRKKLNGSPDPVVL